MGGRNHELALALALHLRELKGFAAASIGTDGVDGPTDAAGAMITDRTITNAVEKGLNPEEYLENNDEAPSPARAVLRAPSRVATMPAGSWKEPMPTRRREH